MIVEYRWKPDGPCAVHAPQACVFEWVPSIEQTELLLDTPTENKYLDKVLSVRGPDLSGDCVLSPIDPSSLPF